MSFCFFIEEISGFVACENANGTFFGMIQSLLKLEEWNRGYLTWETSGSLS